MIELSLTAARTDSAEGLETISNTLTILTLDTGALSFKLNSADNASIPASDGLKIEGVIITDIFWTNTAQADLTAKIFHGWVD